MSLQNFTILVNSSDGFKDCWEPFFKLFTLYWPDCHEKVLLNTETSDWSFPGIDLHCTQVGTGAQKLTWSECLIRALDQVKTPIVLYLQEDYFLESPVDKGLIQELANMMENNADIKLIQLTHFGSVGPFHPTSDLRLWKIDQRSRYRISTQAALWRTETLRSYLKREENGWMFEIYGTRRTRNRDDCFLTVSRDVYGPGKKMIFEYAHTGIIKGKWNQEIPRLFAQHGIEMDFEKRGFYIEPNILLRKLSTFRKLVSNPMSLIRGMGMFDKW